MGESGFNGQGDGPRTDETKEQLLMAWPSKCGRSGGGRRDRDRLGIDGADRRDQAAGARLRTYGEGARGATIAAPRGRSEADAIPGRKVPSSNHALLYQGCHVPLGPFRHHRDLGQPADLRAQPPPPPPGAPLFPGSSQTHSAHPPSPRLASMRTTMERADPWTKPGAELQCSYAYQS